MLSLCLFWAWQTVYIYCWCMKKLSWPTEEEINIIEVWNKLEQILHFLDLQFFLHTISSWTVSEEGFIMPHFHFKMTSVSERRRTKALHHTVLFYPLTTQFICTTYGLQWNKHSEWPLRATNEGRRGPVPNAHLSLKVTCWHFTIMINMQHIAKDRMHGLYCHMVSTVF